jgi:hypothetical protein
MTKFNLRIGLAAILGLGVCMTANAQVSCSDLTFTAEAYEAYDQINAACIEVVDRDGQMMAKFEAEVVAQSPSGTYVRYTHADGSKGPSTQIQNPDFIAHVDGQDTAIGDLNVRQNIRVYVGDEYWSLPAPEVAAAPPPPPPPPPEPEPEPEPVMPTTAGNLGWLALFGGLFLVLGGALRFSRQQ